MKQKLLVDDLETLTEAEAALLYPRAIEVWQWRRHYNKYRVHYKFGVHDDGKLYEIYRTNLSGGRWNRVEWNYEL